MIKGLQLLQNITGAITVEKGGTTAETGGATARIDITARRGTVKKGTKEMTEIMTLEDLIEDIPALEEKTEQVEMTSKEGITEAAEIEGIEEITEGMIGERIREITGEMTGEMIGEKIREMKR